MTYKVLLLGACCAGKTSIYEALRERFNVIESDDAVLDRADGIWPSTASENRRVVVETAAEALAMEDVIHISSFVPTAMIRAARADGFTVAPLRVPLVELERGKRERQQAGGHHDMSHWFASQLESYAELDPEHLVDHILDGTEPLARVVASVASLTA